MFITKKTKETISEAVKDFLNENSCRLKDISIKLISEKIFTNKKQYTVEIHKKNAHKNYEPVTESDKQELKNLANKILNEMYFNNFDINIYEEQNYIILKIKTNGKDGLLIGKNGQNICSLQYLLSIIFYRTLRKHIPLIIDIDSYYEKHITYLKNKINEIAEKLTNEKAEYITELLPPNERKIIHEEIAKFNSLKTFSIGKGIYKKVVITSLL